MTTTPHSAVMIALMGAGVHHGAVSLSRDEFARIKRLYAYTPEPPNKKPAPPERSAFKAGSEGDFLYEQALRAHAAWEDPQPIMQAGADRNALRHAEADGLRLLAWVARYVTRGEDPLRVLIQMAIDSGFDVDPADVDWVTDEAETGAV